MLASLASWRHYASFARFFRIIFDREIAQALAVLQVAIVSIDFKRFVYTDLDD